MSASATVPPIQQKPIPHVYPLSEPVPFVSGQQSCIDISPSPPTGMAACVSPDDIATAEADAPAGSIASDMATANARMVRTIRMKRAFNLLEPQTQPE